MAGTSSLHPVSCGDCLSLPHGQAAAIILLPLQQLFLMPLFCKRPMRWVTAGGAAAGQVLLSPEVLAAEPLSNQPPLARLQAGCAREPRTQACPSARGQLHLGAGHCPDQGPHEPPPSAGIYQPCPVQYPQGRTLARSTTNHSEPPRGATNRESCSLPLASRHVGAGSGSHVGTSCCPGPRRSLNIRYLLLLLLPVQESHQTAADFRLYVENRTRHLDAGSRRPVRVYQLYSRSSSGHLQVLGKRVRANGEDGNKYGASLAGPRGEGAAATCPAPGSALDGRSRGCVFVEEVLENNYTAFMSARHRGWYLGFTRKGRAQRGPRTHRTQREGHFMKRPPKGTGGEGQSSFRFTALTPPTKRALGP
ncbi:perforin-1-like [Platysternon megacephalum]|uniref:Perforin-1-like n=1 Tax=Platysternon megacephalum TaxID=55544 RepID=A0A4D9DHP0_9SAUR|nr:perforin-1-like [Platysternon megacephalum]